MTAPAEAGLLDRDAAHLWHPYGAAGARQLYAVRGARGVHLDLEGPGGERHRAIDAMASWWSVVHGHGHPALVEALTRQAAAFPHVMFGGLTHAPAVDLAERLVAHTPAALEHVFLADSGSVSVEVALKLALQYQATRGRPSRRRFLTVRGGYHGDTAAPMGVCDPVDGMHAAFTSLVARHLFLPRPPAARWVPEGVAGTVALVVMTLLIAYLSLVLGELVPKRIGQLYPEPVARFVSRPMRGLATGAKPFVLLLSGATAAILKLLLAAGAGDVVVADIDGEGRRRWPRTSRAPVQAAPAPQPSTCGTLPPCRRSWTTSSARTDPSVGS